MGAVVVDRIAEPWGPRTPYGAGERWPVRVDRYLGPDVGPQDVERWVQSAAILHSNGDALDIGVTHGRMVGVRGRAIDRVNRGRVDPKDLFGWQANHAPDRLTRPLVREDGELVETDWDAAMSRIVERSKELLDGPGGWGPLRLRHQRSAVLGGVLHPGRARQGRHRHAAHGRHRHWSWREPCSRWSGRVPSVMRTEGLLRGVPAADPPVAGNTRVRRHRASEDFPRQLAGLLHPRGELSFVEPVVLTDVEVAHFLVLGLAGRERTQ